MKPKYTFELFCIEPEDINNERSFVKALSFSEDLWLGAEPSETETNGIWELKTDQNDIVLKILPIDTTKVLTEFIETAFIVKCSSDDYDLFESFRLRLLKHLKARLKFQLVRLLRDDISTHISNRLYPEINKVENLLRRYLIKFFIQRVGLEWWEVTAEKQLSDKVKLRKKDRKDEFSNYVEYDIEYADFDDLGTLIYKQTTGFNQPEKALEMFLSISNMEQLEKLKIDIQGNYTKYFKDHFRDKNFEGLWKKLFRIRNKVAHQGTFYNAELEEGLELAAQLVAIVEEAENQIDNLVLTVEEKIAIRQASIEALTATEVETTQESQPAESENKLRGLKVIGKIELPESKTIYGHKVISKEELLHEIGEAEQLQFNQYVGLKWFVTEYLAEKNYSIGFSYSLINILNDEGDIELYDVEAHGGYNIKAIRLMERKATNKQ